MPISPARVAAFDILLRVEREFSYATELLHADAYDRLSAQDHALSLSDRRGEAPPWPEVHPL